MSSSNNPHVNLADYFAGLSGTRSPQLDSSLANNLSVCALSFKPLSKSSLASHENKATSHWVDQIDTQKSILFHFFNIELKIIDISYYELYLEL